MDNISNEEFEKALSQIPERTESEKNISEIDFNEMLKKMQNPAMAQKELAVQIKLFLDKKMDDEMKKNGCLGENTRKWIETYNNILEKLQKSLHGDKSVNLHVHKVSHGEIAAKIRESIKIIK